jgi:16S rRNA A1518/A1519 N6-dimethyltransferase RsmA/KsgA/DIM1 with predicted DNA glycosylase/AP lyase activity
VAREAATCRLTPDPERRDQLGDRRFFQEFLRGLFQQRRKVVRKVLAHQWEDRLSPERIAEVLTDVGLTGSERAEQLPVDTLIRLSRRLAAEWPPDRRVDTPADASLPPLTTTTSPGA